MICNLVSGKGDFPLPLVYVGKYWVINQAYPSKLEGWLVLSLKNHKTAFHKLNKEEIREMGEILSATTKTLNKVTKCKKEYILSSNEGIEHFHFHIVPRKRNHPKEWIGGKVYSAIRIKEEESIPVAKLIKFTERFKREFRVSGQRFRSSTF